MSAISKLNGLVPGSPEWIKAHVVPRGQVSLAMQAAAEEKANKAKPKPLPKAKLASGAVSGMQGGGQGHGGDQHTKRVKEIERKLAKLTSVAAAEDPTMAAARVNARKFARIVACPDELGAAASSELPVVPSSSTSRRYSLLSTLVSTLNLRNNNVLAEIPGQTLFCARVINTGTSIFTGALLALNMGASDLCWTLSQVGIGAIPAGNSSTRRLVPQYHFGYLMSCDTVLPPPPVVCEFTQTTGTGLSGSVWYPITDGAGNYSCLAQQYASEFRCVVICDVTLTGSAGTGSQVGTPISAFSSGGTTVYVTPLFPSTGAPVRSMLQLEGAVEQAPGDVNFFPYLTVCSNLRLQSLASALVNKFNVVTYSVGGGREGVYAATYSFTGSTTSAAAAPTWQTVASRSRQHSMGMLDPDNNNWYACNVCTRICNIASEEAPAVCDFSYVGTTDSEPGVTSTAYTPVQDSTSATQRINFAGAGWGSDLAISLTVLQNGLASGSSTVPVSVMGHVLTEHYIPSNTGLHTSAPQYFPEASNWLQVVSSYPALARADSFNDYLKSLWGRVKSVGAAAAHVAAAAVKGIGRDRLLEALLVGAAVAL